MGLSYLQPCIGTSGLPEVTGASQSKCRWVPELGKTLLHAIRREELQDFLDRKALVLSSSVVSHMRWFLNGIFKHAMPDGVVLPNPASEVRIPREYQPGRAMHPPGDVSGAQEDERQLVQKG